jgi:hypothetical protein
MARALVWHGLDPPRMEIAYVEHAGEPRAHGTQIGVAYEPSVPDLSYPGLAEPVS